MPIGETSLDDWNWVLSINLWGPIHGCHVFAPILREARYGGIINVAAEYLGWTRAAAAVRVNDTGERLRTVLDRADRLGVVPHVAADRLAQELIVAGPVGAAEAA